MPQTIRLAHGIHRALDATRPAFLSDLLAWQRHLPAASAFSALTAALIHDLWLPPAAMLDRRIHVAAADTVGRSRHADLVIARHAALPPSEERRGLRVTTAPQTVLACALHLRKLDLIVLIDSALNSRACTTEELWAVATQRRGSVALRDALPWVDRRSESPFETLLRVLAVSSDIPVVPQARVTDDEGSFLARADLLIAGTRTLLEYDGSDHLSLEQFVRDRPRDNRILEARYQRHGYTASDVRSRAHVILRHADAALRRPHDPSRLEPWYALLRESGWR